MFKKYLEDNNLSIIIFLFKFIYSAFINALPYTTILVLWQLLVYLLCIPNYIIPAPLDILYYILEYKYLLINNATVTIIEAVSGLMLAIVASIFLGIIALYSSYFINLTYKLLLLIQIIPLMAIAPLIIIWFGFGITAKILIVFTVCLFPCMVSFLRGSLNIDKEYFDLLKTMGGNKWQVFKIIIFPSSCYSLFSGLKIAVTYSVTSAVIAEYLGAEKGIGIYITRAISSFDNNALFSNIFCIAFVTLLLYKILTTIEKFLIPWNNNNKSTNYENL